MEMRGFASKIDRGDYDDRRRQTKLLVTNFGNILPTKMKNFIATKPDFSEMVQKS